MNFGIQEQLLGWRGLKLVRNVHFFVEFGRERAAPEDQDTQTGTHRCPAPLSKIFPFYAKKFTLQALFLLRSQAILVQLGTLETCIVEEVVAVVSKMRPLEVIVQPLPGAPNDPAFRAFPMKVILFAQANAHNDFTLTKRNLIGKFEVEPDPCGGLVRLSQTSDGNNLCTDTLNYRRRRILPWLRVQGTFSESHHFRLSAVFIIMARCRAMLDHKTANTEHRPTPETTAQ